MSIGKKRDMGLLVRPMLIIRWAGCNTPSKINYARSESLPPTFFDGAKLKIPKEFFNPANIPI
jgi:hypothetical protein